MFRTRDFVLIFTSIVFLVSAIGATVFLQQLGVGTEAAVQPSLELPSGQELRAVAINPDEIDRAARIADMRSKIAAKTIVSSPEDQLADEVLVQRPEQEATTTDEIAIVSDINTCANYAPYLGFWDARDLSVTAREGAIVVTREAVNSVGSSTSQTVLQLPARTAAAPSQSCIGQDVIGVANDGSLIRNDEAGLYRIFGSGTIVGYALDGFPIYVGNAEQTDVCGGASIAGQYAYYLNPEREVVINCYSAAPVNLP